MIFISCRVRSREHHLDFSAATSRSSSTDITSQSSSLLCPLACGGSSGNDKCTVRWGMLTPACFLFVSQFLQKILAGGAIAPAAYLPTSATYPPGVQAPAFSSVPAAAPPTVAPVVAGKVGNPECSFSRVHIL